MLFEKGTDTARSDVFLGPMGVVTIDWWWFVTADCRATSGGGPPFIGEDDPAKFCGDEFDGRFPR